MSLKFFIRQIWNEIKSLFENFPDDMNAAVHLGVLVTENIKTFVDSPAADILTTIIPGDLDDELKNLLRAKLPEILTELKLADSCSGITDPQQITTCAIKVLQGLGGNFKSAFLHNLSIFIAQIAAKGSLKWSEGVSILEWYYKNEFKTTA